MKVGLNDRLKRLEFFVRAHASVQALFFVLLFFSVINMVYAFGVIVVFQTWLPTWRLDRRFPFSAIPLWAFFLVSLLASVISLYYYPKNRPKLACDRANGFFVYVAIGLIVWIFFAFSLIHTFYIGDFYIVDIIQNIFSGRGPLELSRGGIDLFPTLGDTVFIAYLISFLSLYLASWRAFRAAHQTMQIFVMRTRARNLESHYAHWEC